MHVLFLASWYPATPDDVTGSFFREQAHALRQAGCKVGVISPQTLSLRRPLHAMRTGRGIRKEMDAGIPTYRKTIVNWTPRMLTLSARRVERSGMSLYRAYIADHGRPDVIHVHVGLLAGAVARKIARQDGVPYVLSEHSSAYTRGLIGAAGIRLAHDIARNAAARFAVSSPFARILEDRLTLPAGSFEVMPNLVEKSFLTTPLAPRDAAKTRFLHISLLDSNKRVELLIRAFARQFPRDPDVTLTISGDGTERAALIALAADLGVADRVSFPGRLSRAEVIAALADSDAFVLTSRHETFGVVLIEALAMGLPLIATRCGGPEDIVTPHNGILVPTEDVDALATAMAQLHKTREDWPAEKLRADCTARFGPDAVCRQWIAHYERVAAVENMKG